jgi:excisionase family DNA binding protein
MELTTTHQAEVSQNARMMPLLSAAEVAEILKVSSRSVLRYAREGRIECVQLGHRTVRFTPESVAALIRPTTSEGPVTSGTL